MKKYFKGCLNSIKTLFFLTTSTLQKYLKKKFRKNDFFSQNLFSNNQEQPAIILSSEEINNLINQQANYSERNPTLAEYKIVKGNIDDNAEKEEEKNQIESIKQEIDNFVYDEDEDEAKNLKKKTDSNEASLEEHDTEKDESIDKIKESLLNVV